MRPFLFASIRRSLLLLVLLAVLPALAICSRARDFEPICARF